MKSTLVRNLVFGALAAAYSLDGCRFTNILRSGFDATFYELPLGNEDLINDPDEFFKTYYKELGGQFTTATGVTDVSFNGGDYDQNVPQIEEIYGQEITASNFTVELLGYFKAEETGTHVITLAADDGFAAYIGGIGSCCADVSQSVTYVAQFSGIKPDDLDGTYATKSIELQLEEGFYYPIRILYVNRLTQWIFSSRIEFPSGKQTSIFDMVYQIDPSAEQCEHFTTTATTGVGGEYPTPGTFTPTDCSEVETCTVVAVTADTAVTYAPNPSYLDSSDPDSSDPEPSEPDISESEASETDSSESEATDPDSSDPDPSETGASTTDSSETDSSEFDATSSDEVTTTITTATNSEYSTSGTYTPSDCSEAEMCTVAVVRPDEGTGNLKFRPPDVTETVTSMITTVISGSTVTIPCSSCTGDKLKGNSGNDNPVKGPDAGDESPVEDLDVTETVTSMITTVISGSTVTIPCPPEETQRPEETDVTETVTSMITTVLSGTTVTIPCSSCTGDKLKGNSGNDNPVKGPDAGDESPVEDLDVTETVTSMITTVISGSTVTIPCPPEETQRPKDTDVTETITSFITTVISGSTVTIPCSSCTGDNLKDGFGNEPSEKGTGSGKGPFGNGPNASNGTSAGIGSNSGNPGRPGNATFPVGYNPEASIYEGGSGFKQPYVLSILLMAIAYVF